MRNKIGEVLLTIYLTFVWVSYIFTYITSDKLPLLLLTIMVIVISHFISRLVISWVGRTELSVGQNSKNKKIFWLLVLAAFVYAMIWYIAYYPGSFSADMYSQYYQALHNDYNDWHPSWHTFVIFKIPMLFGAGLSAIVFVQLVYFAFIVGYMAYVIYKHFSLKASIASMAYIFLNPYVGFSILYPWKDCAFAFVCLLALTMAADYIFSKENVKNNTVHLVLIGVALGNATLFRHNGILFTFFLALALFFRMERKSWYKVALSFLITVLLIKGPIYSLMGVDTDLPYRTMETMGLPMNIIASTAAYNQAALDDETRDFVNQIAATSEWAVYYQPGNLNTMKWTYTGMSDVAEEWGSAKIMSMAFRCLIHAPNAALKGFFSLTDLVYGLDNGIKNEMQHTISETAATYGVEQPQQGGVEWMQVLIESYKSFLDSTVAGYLRTIGMSVLLIIICALAKTRLNTAAGWKKLTLAFPVLAYDFGTGLLLTGPDSRFFLVSFLCLPVTVLLLLRKENESEGASLT